jgi:hypothetical protein
VPTDKVYHYYKGYTVIIEKASDDGFRVSIYEGEVASVQTKSIWSCWRKSALGAYVVATMAIDELVEAKDSLKSEAVIKWLSH